MQEITRRGLVTGLASSGIAAAFGSNLLHAAAPASEDLPTSFIDILRTPDSVTAFLGLNDSVKLGRSSDEWSGRGIRVSTTPDAASLAIRVAAPDSQITHVLVRWNAKVVSDLLILGDAWERSYGDLHWSSLVPERAMPWYFMTSSRHSLHGYGVMTGASALCFWQLDQGGVSLWLNICNGGAGVELGGRELLAATVVSRRGEHGEDAHAAARAFCRTMCKAPRAPVHIYGSNDWYYAYGKNTGEQIVRDADLVSSVSPSHGPRPFTVIDDGWKNKQTYPDMATLAAEIRKRNVRPGLWIRPLEASSAVSQDLLLPATRFGARTERARELAYDPTVSEALTAILAKVTEATGWGYELVKHDYSTYDLLGLWGSEMKAQPTLQGWSFHDRSRTNAEIVRDLYHSIRLAAGERTILVGCNTIGHLGAGVFDAQRTGDDVSGKNWERTRRMGVNTVAYRLPQHRAFFELDADCVPITTSTPWTLNRQWLDLQARSGTVLLVSPEASAMGEEQRNAIREAFQLSVAAADNATVTDWQTNTTPAYWQFRDSAGGKSVEKSYGWCPESGAWPYDI
jgi:alpha-galactosidase